MNKQWIMNKLISGLHNGSKQNKGEKLKRKQVYQV